MQDKRTLIGLVCLYAAGVLNTLIYDTIYGHQDLTDDLKAGVKSVAVAWRDATKRNCAVLAALQVVAIKYAGSVAGLGLGYDVFAVGGTALVLAFLLSRVHLTVPTSCMWCFTWLIYGTGAMLSLGLVIPKFV